MKIKLYDEIYKITRIEIEEYANNRNLTLQMMCEDKEYGGEDYFAKLTINLNNGRKLDKNEAYVDTNNCPWAEDFINKYKLGQFTNDVGISGYCIYPLYKFDLKRLEELNNGKE